ncbi:MAG: T9SS type B sorting domain-containing protein [Bacteroidota bacterium]
MANKLRLLVFILFSLFSSGCLAEGTKQLKPDSTLPCNLWAQNGPGWSCFGTEICDDDHSLFVHIRHAGEKVFMGFLAPNMASLNFKIKLNGVVITTKTILASYGSPGYIQYYSQAVAGPGIMDPHGYPAVTFTPPGPGDYRFDFIVNAPSSIHLALFDITVADTTKLPLTPINGRLWSKDWSFEAYNPFLGTMYILTSDSIVTSVNFNRLEGYLFDVTSTRNGCFPSPAPWSTSCLSLPGNFHYPEYKIFLNNPDSIEYPTGTLGVILGDTVKVSRSCNGTFNFTFAVNKSGIVKLNIEPNLAPGIQGEDLTLNYNVQPGINTILWDGKNGWGNPVPCGDSVQVTINYVNGLTNLALYDVENHPKGFIIQSVRPAGPPITSYWNDTLLAALGGLAQLTGCNYTLPDIGCHSWIGDAFSGLGNNNTVNTWWYASSSLLNLGRFSIACVPHTPQDITGPTSFCASAIATYTTVPDPVPGTDRLGYEWVLTDVGTGAVLFDSVNIGPSVKIHFSQFPPGPKRLKVRGRSSKCGLGPFGPGTAGEGILISPELTTQINNTNKEFTMCSGGTTSIALTASLTGTTYSYTASASSSSTTGYAPGNQNPISQILVNSGNMSDTVFYHVVPYLAPCPGDTETFAVVVNPLGLMNFIISASANPLCTGLADTFSVATLIGGPLASYQWHVNGMSTGPDAPVFIYTPVNGDTVQCIITSSEFCTAGKVAYSQKIIVNLLPLLPVTVSITPSADPVCKGDPVTFSATPSNGGTLPSYQWSLNGVAAGTDTSHYTFVPRQGDKVICILTSNRACVMNTVASDTLLIALKDTLRVTDTTLCYGIPWYAQGAWQTTGGIYHDILPVPVDCIRFIETNLKYKPRIPVDLGKDTTVCGSVLTLHAYVNGGNYQWQDGSVDSVFLVTGPGEYKVIVSYDGCSQRDSINIGECPVKLWFPNSFTPNGDGHNDTYRPVGKGVEKFSMSIYNRWGELIFETNSLEPGWDGTFKGTPCAEDTYIFIATYSGSAGKTIQEHGTIILQHR